MLKMYMYISLPNSKWEVARLCSNVDYKRIKADVEEIKTK